MSEHGLVSDTERPMIEVYLDDPSKVPVEHQRIDVCLPVMFPATRRPSRAGFYMWRPANQRPIIKRHGDRVADRRRHGTCLYEIAPAAISSHSFHAPRLGSKVLGGPALPRSEIPAMSNTEYTLVFGLGPKGEWHPEHRRRHRDCDCCSRRRIAEELRRLHHSSGPRWLDGSSQ